MEEINWEKVRIDASISILNALLETTQHSVLEEVAIKDAYAIAAVGYADSLIKALKGEIVENDSVKKLKNIINIHNIKK